MSIVVTAATGHLGTLVIDELLQRVPAEQVVAVARNASKAAPIADRGVEVRIADYNDPDALAKEFASRDVPFFRAINDEPDDDGLRGFEVQDADGYVLFFGRPET